MGICTIFRQASGSYRPNSGILWTVKWWLLESARWGPVMRYWPAWNWVNISSDDSLLDGSAKPLSEPILTNNQWARTWFDSIVHFLAKLWADDLEDMGQGKKSRYTRHNFIYWWIPLPSMIKIPAVEVRTYGQWDQYILPLNFVGGVGGWCGSKMIPMHMLWLYGLYPRKAIKFATHSCRINSTECTVFVLTYLVEICLESKPELER